MFMPSGASVWSQAVGDLESLELKQLKRILLRQHDIAHGQVATRPEAKRCDSLAPFAQQIDVEGKAVPDSVAPTGGSADDIERARSIQLVRLLRSEIVLQQIPGTNPKC
jgi:hypothetical protein